MIEKLKVFIADVAPTCCRGEDLEDRLLELENLVNTYGGIVILKKVQKRGIPDYNTYIGSGKIDEIIEEMKSEGASVLIMGNILKPLQIYNLNEKLREHKITAWDRIDLILKIFERHANSPEAKLQIELASIKHMGPRIFGMGMILSRQGLSRGKGETNTEIMKRHLREAELNIRKDLDKYAHVRAEHRKSRVRKNLQTVGIVGYTNAGKSSLMNLLTKKGVLSEDKLFATLGTDVGKMIIAPNPPYPSNFENSPHPNPLPRREGTEQIEQDISPRPLGEGSGVRAAIENGDFLEGIDYSYQKPKEVLVNDTIGFIRDLPPNLIDAFSSTLEDSIEADLLLHVIDASDPKIADKIKVVEDILAKINANQKRLYVFNKIDLIDEAKKVELTEKFKDLNPIFISTYDKIGIEDLKQIIGKHI
ncbi:MAG: 50S ribosome-binding GTPase [Candidatus Gracilibacteria bacterium]|nr:50S ribosome-binding GTPase [Candidatus Gracilibacteria bacterium]